MSLPFEAARPRARGADRRLPRALRRLAVTERGAVLVEFALAMPILALLMVAIIDFSLAMFTLNNLTTAVREGARLAAMSRSTPVSDDAAVIQRVKDQITLSFAHRGATNPTISSSYDANTGNITVTVDKYDYVPMTPVVNKFSMKRQAVFRWERYQGAP
jgi:Flp pilus assembly protein TadG